MKPSSCFNLSRTGGAASAEKPRESGVALVLVLLFLIIISGIVLAFFSSVTTESSSASSYAAGASVKMLSDVVVNLVEAQIQDGTRGQATAGDPSTILSWASQPGAIHTFDSFGNAQNVYKLYSADDLVVADAAFWPPQSDLSLLPSDWKPAKYTDVYTDLNEPVADINGVPIYPIVDPGAADSTTGVEGFSITSPPGFTGGVSSSANNQAPMPVKWLYLLQDGTLVTVPTPPTDTNTVSIAGATALNPIVGRVGFWTDDDTSKVNINTASEGVYWDAPRAYTMEDFGQHSGGGTGTGVGVPGLAICQPAQHEYQRFSGHPATTSLSPILQKVTAARSTLLTVPALTAAIAATDAPHFDAYYALAPRVTPGGSEAGTAMPANPLAFKQDRLYASVDEFMFSPVFSGSGSSGYRVPNTAAGTSAIPNAIDRPALEKVKFFLTADSNAPETTLYNSPRISIWPVWSDANAAKRTAFDNLSVFCSTIGSQKYCFDRSNPRSPSADYSARNQTLYQYLQALTSKNVPGFGGNFLAKYPAGLFATDRDQILTCIYDYIRSTNLQDKSTGATSYTPIFNGTGAPLGAGEVIPITIGQTQGFGRFYSISEADLLFFANPPAGTLPTGLNAWLVLEFATPMQGLGCMRNNLSYTVSGLENFQIQFSNGNWTPLGFVKNSAGNNGTNYLDNADLNSYHGRSLGGTEGPIQAFLTGGAVAKQFTPGSAAHNIYPFCTPGPPCTPPAAAIPIPTGAAGFNFRSTAPTGIVIKIATADTNLPVQTINLQFPSGFFKVPGVGSPSPDGNSFGLVPATATVVGVEVAGIPRFATNPPTPGPDPTAGDTRMVEALPNVPATRYRAHNDYLNPKLQPVQWAHGLIAAVGLGGSPGSGCYNGATFGKLVNVPTYKQTYDYNERQPSVPSRVGNAVFRADGRPGDWDTGIGDQKDGAYINKPDEGDSAFTDSQNGQTRLPYLFGYDQGYASATNSNFSPNRQIPSPMMFGSIPTGIQRDLPWQTLLFNPRPEDATHPGNASPRDHLLADLFWMPVVEPYPISQPFSTSGKINMNYQIQPFTYIERSTGMYAVLKSTKFMALELPDAAIYKPIDPGNTGTRLPNRRMALDLAQTVKGFDAIFAQNKVFRSATQICEMNLVPPNYTAQNMSNFWPLYPLTGDNLREKPYVDLYSRLTTKSNTFTVHMRVQALKKARSTPVDQWVHGKDQVVGEYRGSATIERYIDANDPLLPDFAALTVSNPSDPKLNIDQYYKMRIVSTKRFSPD